MAKIKQQFLVTIAIDTVKAQNFPKGFKDPASNEGDSGFNQESYPNWDINYRGTEMDFLDMVWADFRESFKYDGLRCRIFRVDSKPFRGTRMGTKFEDLTAEEETTLLNNLSEDIDMRYNNVEYWDRDFIESYHRDVGAWFADEEEED